jgi:hypothetical protein
MAEMVAVSLHRANFLLLLLFFSPVVLCAEEKKTESVNACKCQKAK